MPLKILAPLTEYPEMTGVIQENTFMARGLYHTPQVLAVRTQSTDSLFDDLTYPTLIRCLAKHESSFNPRAVGDHGNAKGLLQFWDGTWDKYCEGDIWNAEDQVQCADEMLKADWNNIKHWTTRKFCL